MSPYVQKLRVPVRLSQPNLDPREGWFLLLPRLGQENRPETILELLNTSRSVIPFIQGDDVSVLLLTRQNIDWVAVGPGVASNLVFRPTRPSRTSSEWNCGLSMNAASTPSSGGGPGRKISGSRMFCAPPPASSPPRRALGRSVNLRRVRETRIAESTARGLDLGG